ncbi:MAG TPA: isoprenylcysteine carboxylmethyltransferase family protein [Candidatus Acidoferrales bacterium]|nr:isoprenylcysteine carboxylmethyltransferase family protein [Candidatus Acidoferrales bacterium]
MTILNIILRVYLFAGLAAHKLVWEVLKRGRNRASISQRAGQCPWLWAVKAGKIGVTIALFIQLFLPEILPISDKPVVARIIGVILFTSGLLIAISARFELGNNWSDIETGEVKKDHMLVNGGVYGYIRHPIYSGDLAMLLGFELCLNSWLFLAILVIAIPTAYKAVREEEVLAQTVTGYRDYRSQTKRFIPFVI